jgi:hypothetical protein
MIKPLHTVLRHPIRPYAAIGSITDFVQLQTMHISRRIRSHRSDSRIWLPSATVNSSQLYRHFDSVDLLIILSCSRLMIESFSNHSIFCLRGVGIDYPFKLLMELTWDRQPLPVSESQLLVLALLISTVSDPSFTIRWLWQRPLTLAVVFGIRWVLLNFVFRTVPAIPSMDCMDRACDCDTATLRFCDSWDSSPRILVLP